VVFFPFVGGPGPRRARASGGRPPGRPPPAPWPLWPPPRPSRPGGGKISAQPRAGSTPGGGLVPWPVTMRQVRGWLAPWHFLQRCWHAWSSRLPHAELQALLDAVAAGRPLYLFSANNIPRVGWRVVIRTVLLR